MQTDPSSPPANASNARAVPAPPLWNPNAAANWSLLFSPAFGALLHMKNWQALGKPDKAAASKVWAIATLVCLFLIVASSVLLPSSKALDGLARLVAVALLFGWYFSLGRKQATYVKTTFGKKYPRRGWGKPFLYVLLAFVGLMVAAFVFGIVAAIFAR